MLNTFIRGTATGSGGGVAQHASFQIPFSFVVVIVARILFSVKEPQHLRH